MNNVIAELGPRILPSEIGPVIPETDIAEMIGCDRSAITKKIKAFEKYISPFQISIPLPTSGGYQPHDCLNRTGFDRLILLMRPRRKADENIDRLFELRETILAKLDTEREAGTIPVRTPDIKSELREARELAEACQRAPEAFQAAILKKYGKVELAEALQCGIVHGEHGWYNATELGKMCDLTAEQFNHWLNNNPKDPSRRPFQYRDENHLWRLAPLGLEHGREYTFKARGGHTEPRIEWRESILVASGLRHPISEERPALASSTG